MEGLMIGLAKAPKVNGRIQENQKKMADIKIAEEVILPKVLNLSAYLLIKLKALIKTRLKTEKNKKLKKKRNPILINSQIKPITLIKLAVNQQNLQITII